MDPDNTDPNDKPANDEPANEPSAEEREAQALAAIEAGIAEADGRPPPDSTAADRGGGDRPETSGGPTPGSDDGHAGKPSDAKPAAAKGAAGTGSEAGGAAGQGGELVDELGEDGQPTGRKIARPAEPDPVNDPIPAEVKGRTRERMEKLVSTTKEVTAERDQLRQQHEELYGLITATGATPDQFGETMDYLANSIADDPEAKRRALEYLQAQSKRLAGELGQSIEGVDPLADHPDLQEEVELGDLKRERALEIARQRNQAKAADARRQSDQQSQQQTEAQRKATDATKQALNEFEDQVRAADPQTFAAVRPLLSQRIKAPFQRMAKYTPPEQWARLAADVARDAYETLVQELKGGQLTGAAPPPANGANGAGAGGREPLRPRQPAGGKKAEPSSMMDAIEAGIAAANER